MKPACKPVLIFVLLSVVLLPVAKADILDDVAALLKSGQVKGLSMYFAPAIELGILQDSEEYTKLQAEARIKSFFAAYPPSAAKVIHRINSHSNFRYGVVQLTTAKGVFRVSVSLRNTAGKFLITALKIEAKDEE